MKAEMDMKLHMLVTTAMMDIIEEDPPTCLEKNEWVQQLKES